MLDIFICRQTLALNKIDIKESKFYIDWLDENFNYYEYSHFENLTIGKFGSVKRVY